MATNHSKGEPASMPPPKPLDTNEPVVMALIDAVTSWQGALEQALSTSGLDYVKWVLLRTISREEFMRGQYCRGPVLIDPGLAEHLLAELYRDGWIVFRDQLGHLAGPESETAQPVIPADSHARFDRVSQSVKALHSVSVSPFAPQDRVALGTLLRRMKDTLDEHADRQCKRAPAPPALVAPRHGAAPGRAA
jgi:hypothetical protein